MSNSEEFNIGESKNKKPLYERCEGCNGYKSTKLLKRTYGRNLCDYCRSYGPSRTAVEEKNNKVEATCMCCRRNYLSNFKWGLCKSCKNTSDYEDDYYSTDYKVCVQ